MLHDRLLAVTAVFTYFLIVIYYTVCSPVGQSTTSHHRLNSSRLHMKEGHANDPDTRLRAQHQTRLDT